MTTPLRIARIATGGRAVAPHVAGRLAAYADGDERIIGEIAAVLTPEQLRGSALLPDPLPLVPSARTGALDELSTAELRVLLFAALDPEVQLSELLDAAAVEIDVLLFGRPQEFLRVDRGRARFADERIRSQVLHNATRAERRAAHEALARAALRRGRSPAAAPHHVAADHRRRVELAVPLLAHSEALLISGSAAEAHGVACNAAEAGGDIAARAWRTAALGAFWAGALDDAAEGVRRALELDPSDDLASDLARTLRLMQSGPTDALYSAEETEFIFRTLVASTRNAADRMLLMQLGKVYAMAYHDPRAADSLLARTLLSSPASEDRCWSPQGAAHRAVSELTALVVAGDLDAGARLIARTASTLPLILPGAGIVAGHVRACLGRAPGVDAELARAYEEIGPRTLSRFDEVPVTDMFAADLAVRAGAAAAMATPLSAPSPPRLAPVPAMPLSLRQRDVLTGLLRGLSNRAIGEELGVSHRTVEVHATQILRKYGTPSRSALIALHSATAH